MTTQKDNAVGAMQDFFPNGGRDWDAINAMYEAIAAGKIPGVATGQRVADLEQRVEALHLQAVKDGNHIVELEQYKGLNLSIKENLASTIKELEQRLQQPIKLRKCDIGIACEFISEHVVVSLAAVMVEAATAGFKVEVEGE